MQGSFNDYTVYCGKCDGFWNELNHIACPVCNKHLKMRKIDSGVIEYLDTLKKNLEVINGKRKAAEYQTKAIPDTDKSKS